MAQNSLVDSNNEEVNKILIFSSKTYHWVGELQTIYSDLINIHNQSVLIQRLNNSPVSAIIIDGDYIRDELLDIVRELRTRFRLLVILILATDISEELSGDLYTAGTDDIVDANINGKTLIKHLSLLFRQQNKNRAIQTQSNRIHSITNISQQFYSVNQPDALIVKALDMLCNHHGFYGSAIVIKQGEQFLLYADCIDAKHLREDKTLTSPIFASDDPIHIYNPLRQVAQSGKSMLIHNIQAQKYYEPIPIIENPLSAMVLPLKKGDITLGSLAVFSQEDSLTVDNLATYELLATHFASAYENALQHHEREQYIRFKRHQVRALQAFSTVSDIEAIVQTSYKLIQSINTVDHAVIFVYQTVDDIRNVISYSDDARKVRLIEIMEKDNTLSEAMHVFDHGLQPVTLYPQNLSGTTFADMFALMESTFIVMTPVVATTLVGAVFAARKNNQKFTHEDVNLIETIAQATAQTIERNTLIDEIQQQKGRLEGVVRSIREAIFFVNERGTVIFTNPQFTELTNINPSDVMWRNYTDLLDGLAIQTPSPHDSYEKLESTVMSVLSDDANEEDYPVLEITLNEDRHLYIEFMKSRPEYDASGWVGIVHTLNYRTKNPQLLQEQERLMDILSNAGLSLMEMHHTVTMLIDQYEVLRSRQYQHLLGRAQDRVQDVQAIWQNIMDIYEMNISGLRLRLEEAPPEGVIQDALRNHRFDKFKRSLNFEVEPPSVRVELDEVYFIRAFSNVLAFINYHAHSDAPIFIQVRAEVQHVVITVQEKTLILSQELVDSAFEIDNQSDKDNLDDYPYRLGMHVSREIMHEMGSTIDVDSRRGLGLLIKIYMPIADVDSDVPIQTATPTKTLTKSASLKTLVIPSPHLNIDKALEIVRFEGHELFIEKNLDEALLNMNLMRVDLMIVVGGQQDRTVIRNVKKIRDSNTIPVLVVIDENEEEMGVQALSAGADSYILAPITGEKLVAHMNSVAQRQSIPARVTPSIQVGKLHINFSRNTVYLDNELVDLTGKELEVLQLLAMNKGIVMSREQILTKIWGPDHRDEKQYLWVSVSRLRTKLEPTKNSPRFIHTVKGVGYVFREP